MEEADELCDRVAIIDHGKILVEDTPAALKNSVGAQRVYELDLRSQRNVPTLIQRLQRLPAWPAWSQRPKGFASLRRARMACCRRS